MRRLSLVVVVASMTAACGGSVVPSPFEGAWTGTRSMAPVGSTGSPTAVDPGVTVHITTVGHGLLQLNGFAPARETSATTIDVLPASFATIYGPGYQGPGHGRTIITGGSGQLTGAHGLTMTVFFSEEEAGVVTTTYQATYVLVHAGEGASGPSL